MARVVIDPITPIYNDLLEKCEAKVGADFGRHYGAANKVVKDFSTGKPGQSVRSFNVALSHLDTLGNLADALKNGNIQIINKVANGSGHDAALLST